MLSRGIASWVYRSETKSLLMSFLLYRDTVITRLTLPHLGKPVSVICIGKWEVKSLGRSALSWSRYDLIDIGSRSLGTSERP